MAEENLILDMKTRGARSFATDIEADATAVRHLGREVRSTNSRLQTAGQRLDKWGRSTQRAGRTMTTHVTGPLALAGAASVRFAVGFDKQMRNVNSLLHLNDKDFAGLRNQVLSLAGPTKQAPETLAAGLYDLASSGFTGQAGMKVLKSSAIAATAGLTDTATSTKAVAGVLNAYRMGAGQAGRVSDVLFQTVNKGVVTFDELASTIGQALPIASKMGVSIEQVGAATATMTKQGVSGGEANTRIRSILIAMLKPTTKLQKAYDKLGVSGGEELIKKTGGFEGALQALSKVSGGSTKKLGDLFGRQEAIQGAFALTGKNTRGATDDLKSMDKASGQAGRTFREQAKSMQSKWNEFIARLKVDAIHFGDTIIPPLETVMGKVDGLIASFKKLPGPVRKAAEYVALGLAALGPLLIGGGMLARGAGSIGKLFGRKGAKGALGKAAGKAGVVPVWVTNPGFGGGLPGGKKGSRLGRLARKIPGAGLAARGAASVGEGGGVAAALFGAYAVALGIPAYIGYKYFTRPDAATTLRKTNRRAAAVRRNRNQARARIGAPPAKEPVFDRQGYFTGRYRAGTSAMVAANTAASRGYTGIPTVASARASARATRRSNRMIAANTKAGAGYTGIPQIVKALKPLTDSQKELPKWIQKSIDRPVEVHVVLDGKEIAKSVQRQGKKDKSRR
jgi:TP901 family phage tail tape measure protein